MDQNNTNNWKLTTAASLAVVFLAAAGVAGYFWYTTEAALVNTQAEMASTTSLLNEQIVALESERSDLQDRINDLEEENEELEDDLDEAEDRNEEFEDQIRDITGTVGELSDYATTDPELLRKYSKVYFLSENYVPSGLTVIDQDYVAQDRALEFHDEAYPFLEDLMEEAEDDGIDLQIISAYRSFGEQLGLKDNYVVTYGAGTANQFSAEQGYSEHQLGTTIDFTTPELGAAGFTNFGQTEAFEWLQDNAHRFGFVLSYPEDNQFYIYEPWHWRFVGEDLADDLHDEGDHFYDWEQRELDEYRGDIFD